MKAPEIGWFVPRILALLLMVGMVQAANERFELNGRIDPPRDRVLVMLYGATSPYTDRAFSNSRGRFRFRNLAPGAYTLRAMVPSLDEAQLTVEVTAGLADRDRRVSVTVPFAGTATSREAREAPHKVDARELNIPDSASREFREARELFNRNEIPNAVKRLEKAVEIAPRFTEAWNMLGTTAYHERRFADAERYFRRALEGDPGAYAPAVNLGGVLDTVGRYTEALGYNLYAVQQQPKDALANVQLGMTYYHLGDMDLGFKYLSEAKRLDPGHFSYPQLFLAEIHLRREDRTAAIAEFEDFVKRHPDSPYAPKVRLVLPRLRNP